MSRVIPETDPRDFPKSVDRLCVYPTHLAGLCDKSATERRISNAKINDPVYVPGAEGLNRKEELKNAAVSGV
ncbi:hypothetical protein [Methylovirgula ligni]|uniref:hypothetical protein n=1 Tax=Methylovirgula ligni TaxID=569860 RepID=UPI001013A650|nr:hypothetical protein [Methylovirgula ligni]